MNAPEEKKENPVPSKRPSPATPAARPGTQPPTSPAGKKFAARKSTAPVSSAPPLSLASLTGNPAATKQLLDLLQRLLQAEEAPEGKSAPSKRSKQTAGKSKESRAKKAATPETPGPPGPPLPRVRLAEAFRMAGLDEHKIANLYVFALGKLSGENESNEGVAKLLIDVLKECARVLDPPRSPGSASPVESGPVTFNLIHSVERPVRPPLSLPAAPASALPPPDVAAPSLPAAAEPAAANASSPASVEGSGAASSPASQPSASSQAPAEICSLDEDSAEFQDSSQT
jgi:hypothetical protein